MLKHALIAVMMVTLLAVSLTACSDQTPQTATEAAPPAAPAEATPAGGGWTGQVAETMNSGGYTYVLLDTGEKQYWVAAPQTEVAVGQRISVPPGMLMKDFASSTLERTFPEIWFVNGFMPEGHGADAMPAGHPETAANADPGGAIHHIVAEAGVETVAKAEGGYDIAGIFAQSSELSGRTVKVRGRVVKFSANIMGTNWVHIQDGTGSGSTADLTVTTPSKVSVGDVVLVEGPLAVDKDFGSGYRYTAIIENAAVTKE